MLPLFFQNFTTKQNNVVCVCCLTASINQWWFYVIIILQPWQMNECHFFGTTLYIKATWGSILSECTFNLVWVVIFSQLFKLQEKVVRFRNHAFVCDDANVTSTRWASIKALPWCPPKKLYKHPAVLFILMVISHFPLIICLFQSE